MNAVKRVRSLRSDYSRNHQTILEIARELYQRDGAGMVWSDLAKETGFTLPTLYTHFPTRENLIDELFEQMVEAMTHEVERIARDAKNDPFEKLDKIFVHLSKQMLSNLSFPIILQEYLRINPQGKVFTSDSEVVGRLFNELSSTGKLLDEFTQKDLAKIMSLPLRLSSNRNADYEATSRLVGYIIRGIRKCDSGTAEK
ncbi:MAG: TetR/AcrR family transcriptional regulator [Microbacteriaceae bacterium]|nr:TetR/AcrR family transcriptional regulator [Microbacteriaceae bacterium]